MGYLYLGISLLAGATKGFCGKKMGSYTKNIQSAIVLNLVRMAMCVLLGFVFLWLTHETLYMSEGNAVALGISALSGITTSVFVVTWLLAVKRSAYMMLDVFLMLGTIVPMIFGSVLFSEYIRILQWFGFVILVIAVLIMCSYNNSIKAKIGWKSLGLLVLCGVANGLTDLSQKLYVMELPDASISTFNLYSYIFAAITLLIFFAITAKKEKPEFEQNISWKKYIYIFIMSLALFANSYFKTKAAVYMDSAQLFLLNRGIALILSSLMAALFFKEKMTMKSILGIILAFIGIVVINM